MVLKRYFGILEVGLCEVLFWCVGGMTCSLYVVLKKVFLCIRFLYSIYWKPTLFFFLVIYFKNMQSVKRKCSHLHQLTFCTGSLSFFLHTGTEKKLNKNKKILWLKIPTVHKYLNTTLHKIPECPFKCSVLQGCVWSIWVDKNVRVYTSENSNSAQVISSYFFRWRCTNWNSTRQMERFTYSWYALHISTREAAYRRCLGSIGPFKNTVGSWLDKFSIKQL